MDFESIFAGVHGTGESMVLYVGMASVTITGVGVIADESMVWFCLQC